MTREQAVAGILAGAAIADELAAEGSGSSPRATWASATRRGGRCLGGVAGGRAGTVCGRGTGVDDVGLARKVEVVRLALAANDPDRADPLGVLAALGGYELAVLAGVCLGGAAAGAVVLLDGFVTERRRSSLPVSRRRPRSGWSPRTVRRSRGTRSSSPTLSCGRFSTSG